MSEHRSFEASPNDFNGEAISRGDREFLKSLNDHPLARHPLYSVPPPPRPNYAGCTTTAEKAAAQKACFPAALDWMLINYAFYADAFMGKGGIISLVDGKIRAAIGLKGFMRPYTIVEEGPNGGLKKTSVVDAWENHPLRINIDGVQTRPDRLRPTFEEDGLHVYNRYWPPAHLAEGGEVETFKTFFARLIPDEIERTWVWNWLSHKARRPWVPMVGMILVAKEYGSGRGTLFEILGLLFGKTYVVPCSFGELTGTSAGARFNDRLADALIAVIHEAVSEDGHQQAKRRLDYEALKIVIEPSPTALRRFEKKGHDAYVQPSAMSVIIATQHRDVVKLPPDDRRISVPTCGPKMKVEETTDIRDWMASPENIGALYRALLVTAAVPADVFDPYGDPPPFAGRLEMIGMGVTRLEDAYEAAIEALEGLSLFTMTQVKKLIGYFGDYAGGDWADKALYVIAKNAYRLRKQRIRYNKRKEIIYACTEAKRQRWRAADNALIAKQLARTEKRVVDILNSGGQGDIVALLKAAREDEADGAAE
jgi:hypothetical protein